MEKDFKTKAVHFKKKKSESIDSKVTPIYQTSAFSFKNLDDIEAFFAGEKPYLYSRVGNPNSDEFAEAVASLESAPAGVSASSGLAAILLGVLAVASTGDEVIATDDLYGGTYELFATELKHFGIKVHFVDFSNLSEVEALINDKTRLLYSESITNPLLRTEAIPELVELAGRYQLKTMIDNTFATPFLMQPYLLGVDLVVHSATKYLGGHSDVTAGVVVGESDLIQQAKTRAINLGTTLSPFEAWLACRGLKTLDVRMERQVANAQKLADYLVDQSEVKSVYYPKQASDKGNGAIVSIDLSDAVDINAFFENLDWIKIVPTLAGVETTVSYPRTTSHRALSQEKQEALNITKGLVRISVGIESSDDIIAAFNHALKQASV
ncbi:Cystathionine beta-lyase/cystathionine gamma-synthase [Pelagirhabdus alkalitolerans]|uniref:homocysteine desulfhydrase n=1 Tax=Pelagirhabdus alkalitolerans TaxID=1612202 RepID=A0A1G6N534_9BACI|nr:PLP-dependent aspartate aminotransferase family protein [Pelagirhabdus alkalitolerans]SDC62968.1 Cystathionine beta-lyase/cystathionine gamma-synthase [Pelagirhabdus alkalitolerans]